MKCVKEVGLFVHIRLYKTQTILCLKVQFNIKKKTLYFILVWKKAIKFAYQLDFDINKVSSNDLTSFRKSWKTTITWEANELRTLRKYYNVLIKYNTFLFW